MAPGIVLTRSGLAVCEFRDEGLEGSEATVLSNIRWSPRGPGQAARRALLAIEAGCTILARNEADIRSSLRAGAFAGGSAAATSFDLIDSVEIRDGCAQSKTGGPSAGNP